MRTPGWWKAAVWTCMISLVLASCLGISGASAQAAGDVGAHLKAFNAWCEASLPHPVIGRGVCMFSNKEDVRPNEDGTYPDGVRQGGTVSIRSVGPRYYDIEMARRDELPAYQRTTINGWPGVVAVGADEDDPGYVLGSVTWGGGEIWATVRVYGNYDEEGEGAPTVRERALDYARALDLAVFGTRDDADNVVLSGIYLIDTSSCMTGRLSEVMQRVADTSQQMAECNQVARGAARPKHGVSYPDGLVEMAIISFNQGRIRLEQPFTRDAAEFRVSAETLASTPTTGHSPLASAVALALAYMRAFAKGETGTCHVVACGGDNSPGGGDRAVKALNRVLYEIRLGAVDGLPPAGPQPDRVASVQLPITVGSLFALPAALAAADDPRDLGRPGPIEDALATLEATSARPGAKHSVAVAGVGVQPGSADDDQLGSLAEAGGGRYLVAEGPEDLGDVLAQLGPIGVDGDDDQGESDPKPPVTITAIGGAEAVETTPTGANGPVSVCRRVVDGEPVGTATTFQGVDELMVYVEYEDMPEGTEALILCADPNIGTINMVMLIDGSGASWLPWEAPDAGGFAPGEYRVAVIVRGEELGTCTFQVTK